MPDVTSYYRHTAFDYRVVWGGRRNLAVHFGYYDQFADRHLPALDNLNRALADFAGIAPGARVLDAGCGRGSSVFWLAENRGCAVTGVNISAHQLNDCRRELARRKLPNVEFVCADYCSTPFPDAAFDVVWACESLCHAPQKHDFYREAFRLLRPGGRLVAAEYLRSSRPFSEEDEALLGAWLRPWAIPDINTAAEHKQHATNAGFSNFMDKDVTAHLHISLRNLHHLSVKWQPWGRWMLRLGIINPLRFDNLCASIRQFEALEKGLWKYGFLMAEKPG